MVSIATREREAVGCVGLRSFAARGASPRWAVGAVPEVVPVAAEQTDTMLLAAMHRGEEAALAALYDRYATPIYSLALRITGERDAAQEVTQDTFLRAWNHAGTYDEARGACGPWLFTIARRRALDVLRLRDRRAQIAPGRFTSDGGSLPDPVHPDPTAGIALAHTVAQAVAALPLAQRQTVELAYFGGLTQQQIAAHTNQPLGTVKSRMRAALETLRERLGTVHVGEDHLR